MSATQASTEPTTTRSRTKAPRRWRIRWFPAAMAGFALWMALLHLLSVPEAKISLLVMFTGEALLLFNLVVVKRIAEVLAPHRRVADVRTGTP